MLIVNEFYESRSIRLPRLERLHVSDGISKHSQKTRLLFHVAILPAPLLWHGSTVGRAREDDGVSIQAVPRSQYSSARAPRYERCEPQFLTGRGVNLKSLANGAISRSGVIRVHHVNGGSCKIRKIWRASTQAPYQASAEGLPYASKYRKHIGRCTPRAKWLCSRLPTAHHSRVGEGRFLKLTGC